MDFVVVVVFRVALWLQFGLEVRNHFSLLHTDLVKRETHMVVTVQSLGVDS